MDVNIFTENEEKHRSKQAQTLLTFNKDVSENN